MKPWLLLTTILSFLLAPLALEAQERPVGIVDEGPEHELIYEPAEIERLRDRAALASGGGACNRAIGDVQSGSR